MKMNGKVHTANLKLNFSLLKMTLNSKYKDHKLRERETGMKGKNFIFSTFSDTFPLLLEQETPYFHFALELQIM